MVAPEYIRAIAMLAACGAFSCATGDSRPEAFSEAWMDKHREELRATPRKREDLVLMGENDKAKVSVYVDEEGKPRFRLGDEAGVSVDVDVGSDEIGGKLKFKRKFGPKAIKLSTPDHLKQNEAPERIQ